MPSTTFENEIRFVLETMMNPYESDQKKDQMLKALQDWDLPIHIIRQFHIKEFVEHYVPRDRQCHMMQQILEKEELQKVTDETERMSVSSVSHGVPESAMKHPVFLDEEKQIKVLVKLVEENNLEYISNPDMVYRTKQMPKALPTRKLDCQEQEQRRKRVAKKLF